ncbi:MAG TPA: DUF2277 domain-containing protein [Candidatus Sulfotelmatobacter sp.]|nr:DUF2277 domain-containing protein [Candidatus Sulfotelmatobacter sp.]
MCRSIKTLRGVEQLSDEEIHAAALQFIRKVSGYRKPSTANQAVFEAAVEDVSTATQRLLADLRPGAREPRSSSAPTSRPQAPVAMPRASRRARLPGS